MPRRVSLPGASELFRPTESPAPVPDAAPQPRKKAPAARKAVAPKPAAEPAAPERRAASGRVRHDEKITVYVSRDELLALEHARLMMRGDFGLAVDRGRIVRESIALAMAQLEALGAESPLVQRLREG